MAKNVQGVKFLRNGNLFGTREAALTNIQSASTSIADGQFILARYGSDNDVKTLVGVKYTNGTNSSLTVFDVEGASADVNKLRQEINAKLGAGITSANTATAQLTALSGTSADGSGVTSVWGAKAYADQKISDAINVLDYTGVTTGTGVYVTNVTEADGKIAATTATLPTVAEIHEAGKPIIAVAEDKGQIAASAGAIDAQYVNIDDAGSIITATNVEGALAEIAAEIDAMDKSASAEDGKVVTTVSEEDGVVSETKANVKDLQLGGYAKSSSTGAIASTDTINEALSKLENKAAAITIANADGSINVTTAATGTDINVNIKSGEHVIAKTGDAGIYTDLDLVKITTGLPTTVKERYQLLATDDSQIGVDIDIYKDSSIVSITYITDPSSPKYQNLEYVYIDASGNTQTEYVDISSLVLEAEFASGITVTDHIAHGVVDSTSEKDSQNAAFLTVGADGFKVSGIKDEINRKINALDVTGDTAQDSKYITHINEENGLISIGGRANISEAKLINYSKGSDSGAVASTDTINQAISKLENQIASKVDALDSTVTGQTTDGKVKVEVVQENGVLTAVTVTGTDIASDAALAELSGKTITAVTSTNSSISASLSNEAGNKTVDIQTDASKIKMTGFTADASGFTAITEASSVTQAVKAIETEFLANEQTTAQALNDLDGRLDVIESGYVETVKVNGTALAETDNAVNVSISGSQTAATATGNEAIVVNTDANGAITLGIAYIDCGEY
jgi:ribosome-associated translation inhibitor RaiA